MAPEYFMHGIIDEKTDVFAFGVLLLELITGAVLLILVDRALLCGYVHVLLSVTRALIPC